MAPGRDDMDWLYGGDDRERGRAHPPSGSGTPPAPRSAASSDAGRRRASFGEEGTPRRRPPRATPRPAPAPPPAPRAAPRPSARRSAAPPPRRTRKRPKHPVRRFFRIAGALIVAWLIFLIATPIYAWSATTGEDVMPAGERPAGQPGALWLLVGSDSREGLSPEERELLGTGDTKGKRTDTMMLLYVPRSGQPALISIPRDSYVPIPGHGRNKINAAYALGGGELLIQTVELNTGLRVEHYAEIGFGGFVNVIDALGGIEMCPKTALEDRNSRLDVPAGCQIMDGPTSLAYARMRYADPLGDIGRMQRQREMVAGIVEKAESPATVLNPFRWWGLNMGAAESLVTDSDTGVIDMAGLIGPLTKLGSGNGLTLMVPVSNTNARTSAGSSMIWDKDESRAMFDEIRKGDTSELGRFSKLPGE